MSGRIPLVDLAAQHAAIRPELEAAWREILETGSFVLGEPAARFERAFAAFVGAPHAIGMNSGTDALILMLEEIRRRHGPGEVVTTPFSFFATAEAIEQAGLVTRFADIDAATFLLDPAAAAAAAGPKTVAILPVHLFGACADMDALASARRPLLEDAAQAVGATYKSRQAGSLGLAGAFSFYPTKNLAAAGDAGAVTTADAEFAERMRSLRAHGEVKGQGGRSYHHAVIGHNSRLDGIQAAVLTVKLRHWAAWQAAREAHAAFYDEALAGLDGLTPPPRAPFGRHVYHQYVVRAQRRDALKAHLEERGIESRVFYPIPLHLQPALAHRGGRAGAFPVAERAAAEVLSLPVHPLLSETQRDRVAEAVRLFYGAR
ncbi:MAG: DegT/DnrJ/EryC1/StrS family aminotransferase [Planctomycetaceae bacterium]